jgi:hypothetical protein
MQTIYTREKQLSYLDATTEECGVFPVAFFVSYGAGHAAALAPVAAKLIADGIPVVCLGLTTAPSVFALHGIEAVRMQDIVHYVESYTKAARLGARLRPPAQMHALVDERETDVYLGVGFLALVREHGLRLARAMYKERGRQVFCPTDFFQLLFQRLKPRTVVATSAPRSERAALEAARALQINRLCLVDLYAKFEVSWCATEQYADRICVLTEEVGRHFGRHGVPMSRIAVTGNPSFDRLNKVDRKALRATFRNKKCIADDMKVVAWISQTEPSNHPFCDLKGDPMLPAYIDDTLAAYVGTRTDTHLVIRLHPNETRMQRSLGDNVTFSTIADSLDELLCGVDCVVTSGSTVGLEAAILGTPVIQYTGSIFSADLPLAKMELATSVSDLAALGAAVDQIFVSGERSSEAVTTLRQRVGSAAANVARQVSAMYLN